MYRLHALEILEMVRSQSQNAEFRAWIDEATEELENLLFPKLCAFCKYNYVGFCQNPHLVENCKYTVAVEDDFGCIFHTPNDEATL